MEMIDTLTKSGYVTQEFILSPLQFGVPYSRPRYFCLVLSLFLFNYVMHLMHLCVTLLCVASSTYKYLIYNVCTCFSCIVVSLSLVIYDYRFDFG